MEALQSMPEVSRAIEQPLQSLDRQYRELAKPLQGVAALAYPYWASIAIRGDNPMHHPLWLYGAVCSAAHKLRLEPARLLELLTACLLHDIVDAAGKTTSSQAADKQAEWLRRLKRMAHMWDSAAESIRILLQTNELPTGQKYSLEQIYNIAVAISQHDYPSARLTLAANSDLQLNLVLFDTLWMTAYADPRSQLPLGPLADLWRGAKPASHANLLEQLCYNVKNTKKRLGHLDVAWEKKGAMFPRQACEDLFTEQIRAWSQLLSCAPDEILQN